MHERKDKTEKCEVKRELMNEYCCQSMYTYLADACTVSFLLDINVSVCHSVQPEPCDTQHRSRSLGGVVSVSARDRPPGLSITGSRTTVT